MCLKAGSMFSSSNHNQVFSVSKGLNSPVVAANFHQNWEPHTRHIHRLTPCWWRECTTSPLYRPHTPTGKQASHTQHYSWLRPCNTHPPRRCARRAARRTLRRATATAVVALLMQLDREGAMPAARWALGCFTPSPPRSRAPAPAPSRHRRASLATAGSAAARRRAP